MIKYIPETNIHTVIRVDDFEVQDSSRLSNDEIIKLFNLAFTFIKEKLGGLMQYSMMNDKIISDRAIEVLAYNSFDINCSFYWEKEYELNEDIANFKSIELHLTNKINEDMKKLQIDKRVSWVYPDIKNVRIIFEKPICDETVTE